MSYLWHHYSIITTGNYCSLNVIAIAVKAIVVVVVVEVIFVVVLVVESYDSSYLVAVWLSW